MHSFINCMAHSSSEGNLLAGETHTALFDCGMMFCAEETIQNVKKALGGRPLDYIIASHTHYDHIGALPFFRAEWPGLRLVTCAVGAAVVLKDTPRRIFRELSAAAAKANGAAQEFSYDDNAFHADVIVKDGDAIDLGGIFVEVIETPGHTRDSLSFLVPALELLILSETLGFHPPGGNAYPCYLTSYSDAERSVQACRQTRHKHLSLPHRGIIGDEEAHGFFERAQAALSECHDFILAMKKQGLETEEMLEQFSRKYTTKQLQQYQPREAFLANARATIQCTINN